MNNTDQQRHSEKEQTTAAGETKGSGHRGDQGEQSRDTERLERDGHEFPRTSESEQGNQEDTKQNQANSEIGIGQGAGSSQTTASSTGGSGDQSGTQKQHPIGSTNPPERHDSWRPSADPSVGDMAPEDESGD